MGKLFEYHFETLSHQKVSFLGNTVIGSFHPLIYLSDPGLFLKAGNLGIVPRKPSPKPERKLPVVSMLSLCLSKKLEMSSTRGIRGILDFEAIISLGMVVVSLTSAGVWSFLLLLVVLLVVDGTFECWRKKISNTFIAKSE